VHGHWTIEVREPDGALVRRVEFDNAFVGPATLAKFLGRSHSVGLWRVQFIVAVPNGSNSFYLQEASWTGKCASVSCSKTLTKSVTGSQLVLSGLMPTSVTGNVQAVHTHVLVCPASKSAASPCTDSLEPNADLAAFTQASGLNVAVSAGQSVQVTVALTVS